MEVHAHTHTSRKKWTHYLWEFLMLFLAVFCGFLAEYQLEHKIEKEKGKEYIISFYEDLKADTSVFSGIILSYERKLNAFKNTDECFVALSKNINSDSCLLNLAGYSDGFQDLVYTDRTLQQLKNAGGLRLLKKSDADSILLYDNLLRIYSKAETTGFQYIQNEVRNQLGGMINYNFFIGQKNNQPATFLYKPTTEKINSYFVLLAGYRTNCNGQLQRLYQIKEKALSLISYFKKKYHLK